MKMHYKPSLWWIALAPLILLLGVGSGTTILLKQVFRTGLSETFTAPAERSFEIAEPGTYILSHNHKIVFMGRRYDEAPELPAETDILLKGANGEVEMKESRGSVSTSDNHKRKEIGRYEIASPGEYKLSVSGLKSPRVLTFSQSIIMRIVLFTAASLLLNLLGWFGAPAIVIIVLSARLKNKRIFKAKHPELFEEEEPLRG